MVFSTESTGSSGGISVSWRWQDCVTTWRRSMVGLSPLCAAAWNARLLLSRLGETFTSVTKMVASFCLQCVEGC